MSVERAWVERRDASFYIAGSRVPLATIVREFQHGQSPEVIRSSFPTLTLEQVYGAITFYIGHKTMWMATWPLERERRTPFARRTRHRLN
jgi:hypothetical protein